MKSYKIWDRKERINGVEAKHFLNQEPFKSCDCDIILIYADNGKVSNVECKTILAEIYGIDATLHIHEFMSQYFEVLKKQDEIIEVENNESVE